MVDHVVHHETLMFDLVSCTDVLTSFAVKLYSYAGNSELVELGGSVFILYLDSLYFEFFCNMYNAYILGTLLIDGACKISLTMT